MMQEGGGMLPERQNRLFHQSILQGETAGISKNQQVLPQPLICSDKQLHMHHSSPFGSSLKLLCKNQNAERRQRLQLACGGGKNVVKSKSITY